MKQMDRFELFNESFGGENGNKYLVFVEIKNSCLRISVILTPCGWGKYMMEMSRKIKYIFDKNNTDKFINGLPKNGDDIHKLLYDYSPYAKA